jgi:two-component system cell cycle response regulator DivK
MSKSVLVVEDDDLNRKLFVDILAYGGFAPRAAENADRALAEARAERPDLILLDIELPRRSGLDVAREIKADAALASVPLVAVTARAMEGDEARIRAQGCEGYISKPICMQGFLDVVRRFADT